MAPEKHPSVRKADYLKITFSKTSCTWNIWDPKISLSPSFGGSVFLQKTIKISFLKGCKCSKYPPKNKKTTAICHTLPKLNETQTTTIWKMSKSGFNPIHFKQDTPTIQPIQVDS